MFCEVISETVLPSKAKVLHEKIAMWYERYVLALDVYLTLIRNPDLAVAKYLASHWRKAERPEEAIGYYAKAAETAMSMFAHLEAVHLLLKALPLCPILREPGLATPIKWHRQLGECYYNIGQMDKAIDHLMTALKLLNEPPPSHQDNINFPSLSQFLLTGDGSLNSHKDKSM